MKQIIVIRKDLKCRTGKYCSQSAHASVKTVIDNFKQLMILFILPKFITKLFILQKYHNLYNWCFSNTFTKICLCVDTEEQLLEVYNKALENNLLCSLIEDNGLTEFHGVKTLTCCSIGPDTDEILKPITGHLRLY